MSDTPAPMWAAAYFDDLVRDMLLCWKLHHDLMNYSDYPDELLDTLKAKADLLERMLNPVPSNERSLSL
jgi:predicted translin family RNA/ssDNA-binding protein